MKIALVRVVKAVAFCTLLAVLVINIGPFFRPEGLDSEQLPNLYAEEDDSIDVLFIGASSMYRYWIPTQAYEEQGFTSLLLGGERLEINVTPYLIEEALKTQDPDLIVVEVRGIVAQARNEKTGNYDQEIVNYHISKIASGMTPSFTRFRMIKDLFLDEPVKKLETMLSLLKYHENIYDLDDEVLAERLSYECHPYKTARQYYKANPQKQPKFTKRKKKSISDELLSSLDQIEEICEKYGKRVLLLSTPYIPMPTRRSLQAEMNEYIASKGYEYIDLNDYVEEIGLNYEYDFYNINHTNIHGAQKVTTYLAELLKNNYEFTTDLSDECAQSWEQAVADWHVESERILGRWEKSVQAALAEKESEETAETETEEAAAED